MSDRVTITFDKLPAGLGEVELDAVTPDRTVALSTRDIAALPVWIGCQRVPLGDVGSVAGERSAYVRLEGDLARAEGVGAGMAGGVLDVAASVGDGAGVAMSGGVLRIGGDAGARLGSALPGAPRGMTGGEILVEGRVGPAAKNAGVEVLVISVDLPFAQGRFCTTAGIKNVKCLSDHRDTSFGKAYGTLIKELRLLSRAIFVVDANDVVQYAEYVPEVANHPNYDAALNALKAKAGAA